VVPGAGSSTWRSPPLLRRSPWTAALVDKVVPGAGSSTPSPTAEYGSQAVARPPPPAAAGVGLHPAGHLSSIEVQVPPPPPDVATRVGFRCIGPDVDSSKAVPLCPPATTGVGFQRTDPTSSMAVPPAPRAVVGVGLHPVGHLSSMDAQVPPPPPDVATGVGFHGIDLDAEPDSSKAVPLPPPATTGVGLQGTDPASSMAVPLPLPATTGVGLQGTDPTSSMAVPPAPAPAPPAAVGVGLLAVGHHSRRPLVPLTLLRSPRTPLLEMVVPRPGSPPKYGSSAVSEFNSSMQFPLPVSHPHPLFSQENGLRAFRRSAPHLYKVFTDSFIVL